MEWARKSWILLFLKYSINYIIVVNAEKYFFYLGNRMGAMTLYDTVKHFSEWSQVFIPTVIRRTIL